MLNLENAVLLPIDMQRGFDEASWPKRWNAACESNGRLILDAWRKVENKIIHVRHDSVVPGSTLSPQHAGNRFRDGFAPLDGEDTVSKSVNAAFIGTDLDLRLRRHQTGTVVVFGISTDMCVSTTIRVGSNMGWKMLLIEDACDCFELPAIDGTIIPAAQVHAAHVATLKMEFCTVMSTQELLRHLT
jgi:nicotinamidase-related amidase